VHALVVLDVEAGEITLVRGDLRAVSAAIRLSRKETTSPAAAAHTACIKEPEAAGIPRRARDAGRGARCSGRAA
jgi:hypothetical protein